MIRKLADRALDWLIALAEPKIKAMVDRQADRVESRLRAAAAEIRDEAAEVAGPVREAAKEVREAAEQFGDAAGLVRRIIGGGR